MKLKIERKICHESCLFQPHVSINFHVEHNQQSVFNRKDLSHDLHFQLSCNTP